MPKIKCNCDKGFHWKASDRLKCLRSRGKIVKTGAKRVDGVVVENEDDDQQSQKVDCMNTGKMNEEDDT
jgi:hypothetical protein